MSNSLRDHLWFGNPQPSTPPLQAGCASDLALSPEVRPQSSISTLLSMRADAARWEAGRIVDRWDRRNRGARMGVQLFGEWKKLSLQKKIRIGTFYQWSDNVELRKREYVESSSDEDFNLLFVETTYSTNLYGGCTNYSTYPYEGWMNDVSLWGMNKRLIPMGDERCIPMGDEWTTYPYGGWKMYLYGGWMNDLSLWGMNDVSLWGMNERHVFCWRWRHFNKESKTTERSEWVVLLEIDKLWDWKWRCRQLVGASVALHSNWGWFPRQLEQMCLRTHDS